MPDTGALANIVIGPNRRVELRALAFGAIGEDAVPVDASNPLPVTGAITISGVAYTDRSIANLSGASETLMAANADRRVLGLHNIGATAVAVNLTGGAASLTVGGSVVIQAGGSIVLDQNAPVGAITIIGTLNADVTAWEG